MWFRNGLAGVALVVVAVGCSAGAEDADGAASDDQALSSGPATIDFALTIAESKEVYDSHVLSFAVKGASGLNLPCRDQSYWLTSKPTLYSGWSVADAPKFSEDVSGAGMHEYIFASCRDAGTQALAWFGKERQFVRWVGGGRRRRGRSAFGCYDRARR